MSPSSAPSPDALLRHAEFVRAVARAALRGDDLVDDVVQETWLAALKDGGRSRRGPLRAWLGGVARRQAANAVRRRSSARRREARAARPERTTSASEVAARAEIGRRLVEAVLSLDEPYRTAVLLRYYDDLPPREVAKRTGVPVETARTHVKRGLAKLRARLDEDATRRGTSWPALLLPLVEVGGVFAVKKILAVAAVAVLVIVLGWYVAHRASSEGERAQAPYATAPTQAIENPSSEPQLQGRGEPEIQADEMPALPEAVKAGEAFHGLVVDAAGTPLEGVTFEVDPAPPPTAHVQGNRGPADPVTTDAEGRFVLRTAADDTWLWVRTSSTKWVPTSVFGVGLSSRDETRIVLVPACEVAVTVVDAATGRPVPEAQVEAVIGVWTQAFLVIPPWATDLGRTDAHGRCVVLAPAGVVRLLAHAEGYGRLQHDGLVASAVGAEVTLRLERGGTVSGVVLDPAGIPVAGARVHVFAPVAFQAEVESDEDGRFAFRDVPSAISGPPQVLSRTHVVLRTEATGWPRAWRSFAAPEPGEAEVLEVVLEPGRMLRGTVRTASGAKSPATSLSLTIQDFGTQHGYASTPTSYTRLDDRGAFAFENLPAGRVKVVAAPDTPYTQEIEVEIPERGEPAPLDIVLADVELVDLRVRVLDANDVPVYHAILCTWRADDEKPDPPAVTRQYVTDKEGFASLPRLPAVPSKMFVDAIGYTPVFRDLNPTKASTDGLTIHLGDGVIEGRAVHPDGTPARVWLRPAISLIFQRGGMTVSSTLTRVQSDEEGRFRFEGVSDGPYEARVDGREFEMLTYATRVRAGDTGVELTVGTREEAAGLLVEVAILDAATLEPVADALQVEMHPRGGKGWFLMHPVADAPGLYRTPRALAPGTHLIRAHGERWKGAEAGVRLVWGEGVPRARILLEREE